MNHSILESRLGIKFINPLLLKQALTHRSYINENPNHDVPHNERLEFLGDAVLGSVVAHFLFTKFPFRDEGFLTKMPVHP